MSGERASYADVGVVARAAIDEALAVPDLAPSAVRVLLVVVRELVTFSRLEDWVSRAVLAERAGITERQTTRALAALSDAGVIEWRPGARGRSSWLSIRRHHPTSETNSGTPDRPAIGPAVSPAMRPTGGDSETSGHQLRDISAPIAGHPGCPTPEKTSEKSSSSVDIDGAVARVLQPEKLTELARPVAACLIIARRVLAQRSKDAPAVLNPERWVKAAAAERLDQHSDRITQLLAANPAWAAEDLADALEPKLAPRPTSRPVVPAWANDPTPDPATARAAIAEARAVRDRHDPNHRPGRTTR